ncbi:MAG: UPF0147 family protein [Candidatus Micrarchaeia archaeon]
MQANTKAKNVEKKIEEIMSLMDIVINDLSVPKNIRKAVSDAKEKLQSDDDPVHKASAAIYALDDVSNDINMPIHARTQIWTILSSLEMIKGE